MKDIDIPISSPIPLVVNGRSYSPVRYRLAKKGDLVMNTDDTIKPAPYDLNATKVVFMDVTPAHRTPTDEDAKLRPECEVRGSDGLWVKRTLIAVTTNDRRPFVTVNAEADYVVCSWCEARIPNN